MECNVDCCLASREVTGNWSSTHGRSSAITDSPVIAIVALLPEFGRLPIHPSMDDLQAPLSLSLTTLPRATVPHDPFDECSHNRLPAASLFRGSHSRPDVYVLPSKQSSPWLWKRLMKLLYRDQFYKSSNHGFSRSFSIFSNTKAAIRWQQLCLTIPAFIQHYIKLEFYLILLLFQTCDMHVAWMLIRYKIRGINTLFPHAILNQDVLHSTFWVSFQIIRNGVITRSHPVCDSFPGC